MIDKKLEAEIKSLLPRNLNSEIIRILQNEVITRVKDLLEKKHLYQSVRVDASAAQKVIDEFQDSSETRTDWAKTTHELFLRSSGTVTVPTDLDFAIWVKERQVELTEVKNGILDSFWTFRVDALARVAPTTPSDFILPTIQVPCTHCCTAQAAHNCGYRGQENDLCDIRYTSEETDKLAPHQTFWFPYTCQHCKGEPLVFMVHRKGLKLTLAGRNHFEKVDLPRYIPKDESEYYSDAVVAFNTGKILASLFLLRTTIEQYMRRVLNITVRVTGEDLADKYARLLHDEFPRTLTSLKVIYEEISVKLHLAEKSVEQFEKSRQDIDKHFQQVAVLPLKEAGP